MEKKVILEPSEREDRKETLHGRGTACKYHDVLALSLGSTQAPRILSQKLHNFFQIHYRETRGSMAFFFFF